MDSLCMTAHGYEAGHRCAADSEDHLAALPAVPAEAPARQARRERHYGRMRLVEDLRSLIYFACARKAYGDYGGDVITVTADRWHAHQNGLVYAGASVAQRMAAVAKECTRRIAAGDPLEQWVLAANYRDGAITIWVSHEMQEYGYVCLPSLAATLGIPPGCPA